MIWEDFSQRQRKWHSQATSEPSCPRMTFKSQLWGALETCRVAKCCKNDSDGLRLGCFGHIHSRPWDKKQSDGSPLGCFGHVRWRPWGHLNHFRAQNQEEPKSRKKTELLWRKRLSILRYSWTKNMINHRRKKQCPKYVFSSIKFCLRQLKKRCSNLWSFY